MEQAGGPAPCPGGRVWEGCALPGIALYVERSLTIETGTIARRVVELAEDKQANEIVLLDIRPQSVIADYFVICSGESDRQIRAIVEHIDEKVHQEFGLNPRREGTPETGWIVLDYDDVVVHVFSPAQREYYRLERLWSKVPPVVVVQ